MIKMKYLFFRGLGFIIYYIFKVLTIIFLSQIQCLGFLKHAKINSVMFIWLFLRLWLHNLKKSQTLQNLWPGWFLFKKRISINCYSFVLCVLRSTMFKTKIFDLLLKCSSLFYCWFFIYNTVCVTVITAFLGIFFWYCTNVVRSLLTELKWKLFKFSSIWFVICKNSLCYQEIAHIWVCGGKGVMGCTASVRI